VTTRPLYPASMKYFGWGTNQIALRDREGEWWIATGEGLCRFSRVGSIERLAVTPPAKVYTQKDGLPANDIFRLFEDSRGDIWIATVGAEPRLSRWERRTNKIHNYTMSDCPGVATAFGNLWIGYSNEVSMRRPSGLLRYRNGSFVFQPLAERSVGSWRCTWITPANCWSDRRMAACNGCGILPHPIRD
jgi:ligand-binding sensor domain-containing protein